MATTLASGKTRVGYTGAAVDYSVPSAGTVLLKLWAGGGGGAFVAPASPATVIAQAYGGNGGFTTVAVECAAGDDLQVWVGGGGGAPNLTAATPAGSGGAAAWPDGGYGGGNTAGAWANGAGGGGSTRVYLNGTLIAIAGAGGGGGSGNSSTAAVGFPGHGGGTTGAPQSGGVTGATQSAGGSNTTTGASSEGGASLKGGNGAVSGSATISGTSSTNPAGGGGGGGYYGGAGGGYTTGNNSNSAIGGSGGSGWFITTNTKIVGGRTINGFVNAPGGAVDADYQAGVGVGGAPVTNSGTYPVTGTAGGAGSVVLNYTPATALAYGPSTLAFTGTPVNFSVPLTGSIQFKMWGGGGGGALVSSSSPSSVTTQAVGANAAATVFTLAVTAGDDIQVWVGGGGGGVDLTSASAGAGGTGGWPDGGYGGANATNIWSNGGGGGGASRIYKNGTLVAVAAGGGGGGSGNTTTAAVGFPGYGGSSTGAPQSGGVTGATSTAGGSNTTGASGQNGGSLFAGPGASSGSNVMYGTSSTNPAGGGGGGGYFGGAGGGYTTGNNGSNAIPGSGGVDYAQSGGGVTNVTGYNGAAAGPGDYTDTNYPAGAGVGGSYTVNSGTYPVAGGAGGAGAVWLNYVPTGYLGTFSTANKVRQNYSGASGWYYVQNSGIVQVKLWAGGGGGALGASGMSGTALQYLTGGNGGFTTFTVVVNANDQLTVWVGGGGGGVNVTSSSAGNGGGAGWPDGGYGGYNTTNFYDASGGGGGSSRLYLNGTLIGIAGAAGGGGGSAGSTVAVGFPGHGGGATGAPQSGGVTGATQSAGGSNTTGASGQNGGSLLGGPGASSGSSAKSGTSSTNPAGGGGGGGYYGGAGGGYTTANNSSSAIPGAGGSGWYSSISQVYNASMAAGSSSGAGGFGDSDYQSGIGVGGGGALYSNNNYPLNGSAGGNGQIVLNFTPSHAASVTGTATPNVTVSTPTLGSITKLKSGALPSAVTLSAAAGHAGISGNAHQASSLPSIGVVHPAGGLQVTVVAVVAINNGVPISVTVPTVKTGVPANVSPATPFTAITLSKPIAAIFGTPHGALKTITLSAPATASVTTSISKALPAAITISAATAHAYGGKTVTAALPSAITLSAPAAHVTDKTSAALPAAVTLSAPAATGASGNFGVAHGAALSKITLTPPAASPAVGQGVAAPIATITVSKPVAHAQVPATATSTGTLKVTVTNTVGHYGVSGSAAGALSTVTLSSPAAGAVKVTAPPESIGTVTLTAPHAAATVTVNRSVTFPTVTLTAPHAAPALRTSGTLPTVTLSAVAASAKSNVYATGTGTLKVTLSPARASYVARFASAITVSGPAGTPRVFVAPALPAAIHITKPAADTPVVGAIGHALGSITVTHVGVTIFYAVNLSVSMPAPINVKAIIGTAAHVAYMASKITLVPIAGATITSPAHATGALPTITVDSIPGIGAGVGAATGADRTIHVSGPALAGTNVGVPIGAVPTVDITAPHGAGGVFAFANQASAFKAITFKPPGYFGQAQVVIIIPVNQGRSITLTKPAGSAHGGITVQGGTLSAINVAPPAASITGAAIHALPSAITISPASATVSTGSAGHASGALPATPIILSAPAHGTATTGTHAVASGSLGAAIHVSAPAGASVSTGTQVVAHVALPTITLARPTATTVVGAGVAGAVKTVTVEAPQAHAAGQGTAATAGELLVYLSAPLLNHTPGAATGALPSAISLVPPAAGAKVQVARSVALPTITLAAPIAAGAQNNIATTVGPLVVHVASAPSAHVSSPYHFVSGTLWGFAVHLTNGPWGPWGPYGSAHVSPHPSPALPHAIQVTPPAASAFETHPVTLPTIDLAPPHATVSTHFVAPPALSVQVLPPQATIYYAVRLLVAGPATIDITAPAATAASSPTLYLIAPEGYADDSKPGKLRFWRSAVSGNAPIALADREIAVNETDGVVFSRDSGGNVQKTPFGALSKGGLVPTTGQNGQILLGDGSWGAPATTFGAPVRVSAAATASGEYFVLSEGSLGVQSTLLPLGTALYRPFFVAKAVDISQIGLSVQGPVAGSVTVGVCTWNIGNRTPVQLLAQATIDVSSAGDLFEPASVTLMPGWYAAIVACGPNSPQVTASLAPVSFGPSLTPIGDAQAPFSGSLTPLPQPTSNATTALGVVMASLEPA